MDATRRISAAWRSVDRRAVDLTVALLLLALMVGELAVRHPEGGDAATTWVGYVWAGLITLPVAVHRQHPGPAVLVAALAVVGYSVGHFVAFPGYTAFALVFLVGLHGGRGLGALAFVAMGGALGVALSLQSDVTVTASTWVSTMLALAVAWLAGENLRSRQIRFQALQERAARLEAEREDRARQAVTEERLRIARELHDVVAHSMSVIAVQAGVANHVIDSRPELARQALATVETNTRAALVEMRRLLGVLRQGDEPSASLVPTPGLADVDKLVGQLAEVGLAVRVRIDGSAEGVPDGVDLSAFRIVQEGLTNVLRHGGPVADVSIDYRPGAVRIAVGDAGRTAAAADRSGGSPAAAGGPAGTAANGIRGAGHGLLGMRERVAVFGGTLAAGPRAGGGFDLVATLPYAAAPRGDVPAGARA